MKPEVVTASARGRKGKPLERNGKVVTRTMQKPETVGEIKAAFGSLTQCVQLAIKARRIELQAEIRLECKEGKVSNGKDGYAFHETA